MSDVIQFLEALARDPRRLDAATAAATAAGVDGPLRDALLSGDPGRIATALGMRPLYACIIATPEQDEPAREDDQPADDDEGQDAPDSRAA